MPIKTVAVQVSANTFEAAARVTAFVKAAKKALEDGFKPGDDLDPLIAAATANLIPLAGSLWGIAAEFKQDKEAFAAAIMIGIKNALEEGH